VANFYYNFFLRDKGKKTAKVCVILLGIFPLLENKDKNSKSLRNFIRNFSPFGGQGATKYIL
jgi:hypothetical protein